MADPLAPAPRLLCKLGSITVHVEEMLSPFGHPVDREALKSLLGDPEVKAWLAAMREQALVPEKRDY